jgi:hypothetical protein
MPQIRSGDKYRVDFFIVWSLSKIMINLGLGCVFLPYPLFGGTLHLVQ